MRLTNRLIAELGTHKSELKVKEAVAKLEQMFTALGIDDEITDLIVRGMISEVLSEVEGN